MFIFLRLVDILNSSKRKSHLISAELCKIKKDHDAEAGVSLPGIVSIENSRVSEACRWAYPLGMVLNVSRCTIETPGAWLLIPSSSRLFWICVQMGIHYACEIFTETVTYFCLYLGFMILYF